MEVYLPIVASVEIVFSIEIFAFSFYFQFILSQNKNYSALLRK